MTRLKKFWIIFLSFLPFGAGAALPWLIGLGAVAGFSIYRSAAPVNMSDALSFFSSCWSCQMFSEIMSSMSKILPGIYHSIGQVTIPIIFALTAIWFAWKLLSGYIGIESEINPEQPWAMSGLFGTHMIKLAFVAALLAFPVPRLLTDVVIAPVFNIGMSVNHLLSDDSKFNECVIATAVADPLSASRQSADAGAYSPRLRYNMACELGSVHQITGVGMTVGWTMLNMAFNQQYMHKILWKIPFFPNILFFFGGFLILVLYFAALLPVPMYFLQVFIKLSMNLIMLPLILLAWLFSGWKITDFGKQSLKSVIDEVVQDTIGIAMISIFVTFAIMFLNSVFGDWQGASALVSAIENNNPNILMDAVMMNNDSLITIILMGLFIAMFMNMIPALIKTLFTINVPDKFYQGAKSDVKNLWANAKKWYDGIKK